MKRFYSHSKWILTAGILYILSVTSCTEPDLIGIEVQPEKDKLNVFYSDTSTVIAYSEKEDSIRSDKLLYNLLGQFTDPVFGKVSASIYTQTRLETNDVNFGTNPVADSLVLSFAYSSYYGDISVPLLIKVYEVTENFYKDSSYYSDKQFTYSPVELANTVIYPNLEDSVTVGDEKYAPHLRIRLNDILAQKFIGASGTSNLADNDNFLNFFKGLYITAETKGKNGSILYFNLLSSLSKLTLYYHNQDDTLSSNFIINEDCGRVNNFDHFGFSQANPVLLQQLNGDTTSLHNNIFTQGAAGVGVKIKFPHLKNWVKNEKLAVNKAEIIFDVDKSFEGSATFTTPEKLSLVKIASNGKKYFLPDLFESETYFGGTYDLTKAQYSFRITRYIQNLLSTSDTDNGLFLTVSGNAINANRGVIHGPGSTIAPLKLRLTFTKLD